MPDQDSGRGAGNARHAMMLGQPEALVAPALCVPGKIKRVAKRLGSVAAFGDRGQVKDGKGDHVLHIGAINSMTSLNLNHVCGAKR
jgi:hypothetical protein